MALDESLAGNGKSSMKVDKWENQSKSSIHGGYPPVNMQKTMEKHNF
jgi:hypothetical protein